MPTNNNGLLVWGRANPEAMGDTYNGVYLNKNDMRSMVSQIDTAKANKQAIPVLIEHTGEPIGHVVSAWVHDDTLQCVLELSNKTLESAIGQQLVKDKVIQELSLGYVLDIKQTNAGFDTKNKSLKEISIVKKGARDRCQILGMSKSD